MAAGLMLVLLLGGCAPHKIYRADLELCESPVPVQECRDNALQAYADPDHPDKDYLLGFIEFDDQGQLFDRQQMKAVLTALNEQAALQDLLIIVFVHGWKHSAAPRDENIQMFRDMLIHTGELESAINRQLDAPPRKIVGVYLGWRGASITVPVIKELTFWERKNTAHKVGNGGVTEVLNRLDLLRRTRNSLYPDQPGRTRLVVVGHSFGGAVVYSALHQILNDRFIRTKGPDGQVSDVRGFGDIVVLLNPAFEAIRFTPLSDMSTERGHYFPSQLPVLAILTSEADWATRIAFPLGRHFSTMFENERDIKRRNAVTRTEEIVSEADANVTAIGHFEPYRTHFLRPSAADSSSNTTTLLSNLQLFATIRNGWLTDHPGSQINFGSTLLQRTRDSAGRNPYLLIKVDKNLIPNHNDIDDPRIAYFVRHLILISSH